MTELLPPSWLQAEEHPANQDRLVLSSLLGSGIGSFSGGISAIDPGHGVVGFSDLAVTQNGTPNMSVNVAAGQAFIRGTESNLQGVYNVVNNATKNLTIATSDPTNPRRDLIIAQVRDAGGGYSGSSNDWRLTVVTGTPAASPADPSLTAYPNALVLARVAVGAGVSSIVTANIADLRTVARSWNQAWGGKGLPYLKKTTAQSTTTAADLTGMSSTWTPTPGRKYEIVAGVPRVQITTNAGEVGVTVDLGGSIITGGFMTGAVNDIGVISMPTVQYDAVSATPLTIKMSMGTVSGGAGLTATGSATTPITLAVKDIGPS